MQRPIATGLDTIVDIGFILPVDGTENEACQIGVEVLFELGDLGGGCGFGATDHDGARGDGLAFRGCYASGGFGGGVVGDGFDGCGSGAGCCEFGVEGLVFGLGFGEGAAELHDMGLGGCEGGLGGDDGAAESVGLGRYGLGGGEFLFEGGDEVV